MDVDLLAEEQLRPSAAVGIHRSEILESGVNVQHLWVGNPQNIWFSLPAESFRASSATNDFGGRLLRMEANMKAPDFTLLDENGESVSLKQFRGKNVVLFFYPKADTPGCTIESCGFRDAYQKLQKAGLVVLGISADTPAAQKKFKEKYELPYPLLADAEKQVAAKFEVLKEKNMYGNKVIGIARTTFLIGPDGTITHVFENVKPDGHAEEVLNYVKGTAKKAN